MTSLISNDFTGGTELIYKLELFIEQSLADRYICSEIIRGDRHVLRNPYQTSCGHTFCAEPCLRYLQLHNKDGQLARCPACEREGEDVDTLTDWNKVHPDNAIKRELSKLTVKCPNECGWVDRPLKELEVHVTQECKKRPVVCFLCGERVSADTTMDVHLQEGLENHLSLITSRLKVMERRILNSRSPDGSDATATVPATASAQFSVLRADAFTHHAASSSATSMISSTGDKSSFSVNISSTHSSSQFSHRSVPDNSSQFQTLEGPSNFAAPQSTEELKSLTERVKVLETFTSKHNSLSLGVNGGQLSPQWTGIVEGALTAMAGEIQSLEQQLSESERKKEEERSRAASLESRLKSSEELLKQREVELEVLKSRLALEELRCWDGTITWKIERVGERKKEAENGTTAFLFSPPFYTDRNGYRMCLRIYLNGDGAGKGTHVSLFLTLMKGEYDALLRWPFSKKITLMILDQSGQENHVNSSFLSDQDSVAFHRPINERNVATGYPKFLPLLSLTQPPAQAVYVKGDIMFVRGIVTDKS